MPKARTMIIWTLVVIAAVSSLTALAGCNNAADKESAAPDKTAPGDANNEQGSGEGKASKTLAVGEKGGNDKVSEVAVTKVTKTNSLTSPEATALLQIGGPGESPEIDKQSQAGYEFVMVTFTYKPKQDKTGIRPVDIKLEDAKDKEYPEVETSGHGGVFNQDPPAAKTEASVTAVYEVPAGQKDLSLTYQPFGDKTIKFKIR